MLKELTQTKSQFCSCLRKKEDTHNYLGILLYYVNIWKLSIKY